MNNYTIEDRKVDFYDLTPGDFFESNGVIFFKNGFGSGYYNATDMNTEAKMFFSHNEKVCRLEKTGQYTFRRV